MKPKRKLLSLLLAICLVAGLMPTTALAAGTGTEKAIQLVDSGTAANIGGGQADNIYFGTYQQSSDDSDGYNIDPIKWRVLENADGQLFLLSDQNLDVFQYHTDRESVTWEKSTMRSWLNGYSASHNTGGSSGTDYTGDNFIGAAFSEKEQKAIAETTVVNDDNGSIEGGNTTTDKIFLLSIAEANNGSYFANDNSRIATNTAYVADGGKIGGYMYGVGEANEWWLRSPGTYDNLAADVTRKGGVFSHGLNVNGLNLAVRPAFNLDLTSVLFTSAAEGGKSASGMDSGLTAVDDYTGSEWKLTLLDETREFAVTEQTVSGKPGDTITLNYTGATTGENEYISVIIADENGAQYYGRVAQPGGESGTATLSIPADLAPGSYTLNVFSEQYNGDYKTDYASAFAEVALTVEEAAAPGIDTGKAIQLVDSGNAANIGGGQADNIYFGTYQQSSDGSVGYNTDPIKWRVLENADGKLFLLSDQNLDVFQYHVDYESVTWATSTMRSWLNGYGAAQNTGSDNGIDYTDDNFIDTAFSDGEQGAIVDTTVVNDDNPTYGTEGGNNTTDKIFLLSIEEVQNADYGFTDNSSRIATNTAYVADGGKIGSNMYGVGKADNWWLRSPGVDDGIAAYVMYNGGVRSFGPNVDFVITAVRPAFNLDLTSVLFTSAAEGGKSANGMDSGLTAIGNYAGNEWKLTLLDKSRDFSISNAAIEGSTVTFSYSNAKTGENEYISAVIENNGEITHYGRILQLDGTESGASGIARLTLPEDVTLSDTTKLYVFNEQYNGGEQDDTKLTDYASAFETVALTVSSDTTASPAALDFGSKTVGYTEAPAAQTVTLTNTGNQNVTVTLPASANYTITAGEGFANSTATLAPNGTAAFTVQPNTGLGVGNYAETLTVSGSNNTSAQVALSFSVVEAAPDTYILTVNLNGGSGGTTGGAYAGGAVVNIDAGSRSNYRFDGWTSSKGGSFADASSASTTFTMPAADTTITANWQYNGGGGGSSYDYYTITASAGTGGSISPSGSVSVREDTDKTFTITPDSGYHISDVLVDGKSVGAVASYTFEDVQKKHTIEAVFAKDNPDTGVNNPFTDVRPDDWFYEAVMFVYQNGLMEGTGDTVFAPGMTTTRSMLATLLYRLEGEPAVTGGSAFTDVADSAWYADAVSWAAENGIVGGYGGGLFGPEDNITREQLATILYRYAQAKGHDVSVGEDTNILSYTDALEISEYAIPAMQWACGAGIIQGNGGYLNPQGDATRAEIATMLMRFCGYYANTK